MNDTTTTEFDDGGPALPELDALARRSSADLRAHAAGFDLARPEVSRTRRLLLVAAVVLLVALAATVTMVVTRGGDDRQRTISGPDDRLFPSYVPAGLAFTGAFDSSDPPADQAGDESAPMSQAAVYASDDDARVVVGWTMGTTADRGSDGTGSSVADLPGEHVTVGGRPAVWTAASAAQPTSLTVQLGADRTGFVLGRGVGKATIEAVAGTLVDHLPAAPTFGAEALPAGLAHLGDGNLADVQPLLSLVATDPAASGSAEGVRAVGWQDRDGGRLLTLLVKPGSALRLRMSTLLAERSHQVPLRGTTATVLELDSGTGTAASPFLMLTWLDGGRQVLMGAEGVSEAELIRSAASIESLTPADYERELASLGGSLGAVATDTEVVAASDPGTGRDSWRVTVSTGASADLCIERRGSTGCGGTGTAIGGSATAPPGQPVEALTFDGGGEPPILAGSLSAEVSTLLVNGTDVRTTMVTAHGRRWFAVPLAAGTTEATVVARAADGRELSREVVSLGSGRGSGPVTTATG